MASYISLYRYTQQGIQNIKQSPARLDEAKELIKAAGGELKGFYFTMGQYDLVTIAEFPDDASAAKLQLAVASQGSVRAETLKAFTEDEYRRIIGELTDVYEPTYARR